MDARPRLDALTGLRFLAAAAVAVVHLPALHHAHGVSPTAVRLMAEGFAGVPFFFVLSGFVLAYTYHARLAAPTPAAVGHYLLARVARIWPVYLLSLVVAAGTVAHPPPDGWWLAANLLLVQVWPPASAPYPPGINPVGWSLSNEVFFYLSLPVLVWAAAKAPRLGRRGLWALAGLVWLPEVAFILWHCSAVGPYTQYAMLCPLVRLPEFVVGVLVGLDFVRNRGKQPEGAAGRWQWTGLEAAACLLVGVLVLHSHRVPLLFRVVGYYTPAFALVVAVFARQRGHLSRLLAGRVAVLLGEASFSFYLLHGTAFERLHGWFSADAVGHSGQAALLLASAVGISTTVYFVVEVPARRWLVGLGRGRKGTGNEPAPDDRGGWRIRLRLGRRV